MVVWIHNIWRRTILRREILSIKMSTPKSNVFSRRKISRLKILSIEYSNCLPQNFKCLVPTPKLPLPPKKVPIPKINMIRGRTKNNQNSCFFLVFATFVFFHFNKKRETAIFTRVLLLRRCFTENFWQNNIFLLSVYRCFF